MNTVTQLPTLSPTDALAAFCKAAGEPLRLNILRALSNDSFGVLELAHIFATGQSGISHHLKVLTQAGLVTSRREGNAIFTVAACRKARVLTSCCTMRYSAA